LDGKPNGYLQEQGVKIRVTLKRNFGEQIEVKWIEVA
jgi:hypothetical protein